MTIDTILDELTLWVKEERPIPPEMWVDKGFYLNLLKAPLTQRIHALQRSLAQKRVDLLLQDKTSAYANITVDASEERQEMKDLEAKLDMVKEFIRLAKLRGRMATEDYKLS